MLEPQGSAEKTIDLNPEYETALRGEEKIIRSHIAEHIKEKSFAIDYINNGCFEITKKTSAQKAFDYLNKKQEIIFADSQREKMDNIGSNVYADSRMQFWETHITEQYLSLLDIGKIYFAECPELNLKQKNTLAEVQMKLGSLNTSQNLFSKLCKMQRFDMVHELFQLEGNDMTGGFAFADFFGGRGTWLKVIKKMLPKEQKSKYLFIYNELDCNKYEGNYKAFNFSFNEPAEELLAQFPNHSVDFVLFNPPYGQNGDRRNANIFLEHLINSKVLKNGSTEVAFVLNKTDILDSMDLISSNFRVLDPTTKRLTNNLEFNHLGQYYFIGVYSPCHPDDIKTKVSKMALENIFDKKEVPNIKTVRTGLPLYPANYSSIQGTDFYANFDKIVDFGVKRNVEDYTTPINSKSMGKGINKLMFSHKDSEIFVPKPLTSSEISFFVATGKLNGDLEVEIEGVKKTITIASGIEKKVEVEYDDETNKEYETTKSVPFMSIYHEGSLKTIQYESI